MDLVREGIESRSELMVQVKGRYLLPVGSQETIQ